MGRHRRRRHATPSPVAGYEHLVVLLSAHRPGRRCSLCLTCGERWPCTLVRRAIDNMALGRHPTTSRIQPIMNELPHRMPGHSLRVLTGSPPNGWFGEPLAGATGTGPTRHGPVWPATDPDAPTLELMRRVVAGLRGLGDHRGAAAPVTAVTVA